MNLEEFKQDIEKKLLKYMFSNVHYIALAEGSLKKEYFGHYQRLFQILHSYFVKEGGIITDELASSLVKSKEIENDDYLMFHSFIEEMPNIKINDDDAEFSGFSKLLLEEYKKKEIMDLASEIIELDPPHNNSDVLKKAEDVIAKKLLSISSDNTIVRASGSVRESAIEQMERYFYLKQNPESIKCIETGLPKIDDTEGGLRYSELVYVIGRKGSGKSILMLNIAYNAWKKGKNVLLFSLEISKEDYERRLAACACNIRSNGLKRGSLTPEEETQYRKYLANMTEKKSIDGTEIGEMVIIDVPAQCTPAFIEAKLLSEQRRYNLKFDMIVIDYAGIMMPDIYVQEKRHQQGQIALSLKNIARKYNCVVLTAAQMNKQGRNDTTQRGGHADSAHVAESDQVADHIDWGIAVMVEHQEGKYGTIESFKTRDAEPFSFSFLKAYDKMRIEPVLGDIDDLEHMDWNKSLE